MSPSAVSRLFDGPRRPAKHVVLLDPEKLDEKKAAESAVQCSEAGVDALFVGGSTGGREVFDRIVPVIKKNSRIPVLLFPGGAGQIVRNADAVLFMQLLSGRNPRFLIEEQAQGAALIREYGLEAVGMGYLLIETDKPSSVQKVSGTQPLSRTDIASVVNHALAAQYFGMKTVYLEGGSGAGLTVPDEMVAGVKKALSIPLIVGGGIRTPETARAKVLAGADFVVTGNVLESSGMAQLLAELVQAVHSA